jgi:molybdopterin-synthase adenylyltransferase
MDERRYSRNEAFFGAPGQATIAATKIVIVGLGGLGSHVAQQLAYLGVNWYGLVDFDLVTDSSMNRLIGAMDSDVTGLALKIGVAERTIKAVQHGARITTCNGRVNSPDVALLIAEADIVFGCVDRDLARLQLTEACSRYAKPLFDLATGTGDEGEYGGRVVLCDGTRCLVCLQLLDQDEIARDSMSPDQREEHDRIYGIDRDALNEAGPMVVSVNGTVASIAITEFMNFVTALREPAGHLTYRGDLRRITSSQDQPEPDCYFCKGIWGSALPPNG